MNEFLSALDSVRIPTRAAFDSGTFDPSDARPGLGPAVTLTNVLQRASVAEAPSSIPAFRSPKWGWIAGTLAVALLGSFAIVLRSIGLAVLSFVLCGLLIWFLLRSKWPKTEEVAAGAPSYSGPAIPPVFLPDQPVDAEELDTVEMTPYTPPRPSAQQKMTVVSRDLLERYKQLAQSQYPVDIPLEC